MRFFTNLNLTSKIVMLVALLGALSVSITLYSMHHLYSVDRDYRALLDRDAQASMLVGSALLDLSDASRLVFSVLTEQEEAKMRASQLVLDKRQEQFRSKIAAIAPLLDDAGPRLEVIAQQERRVFELAGQIIDSAARWRGDRALDIIHSQFDPALHELRGNMDTLRDDIIDHFQASSVELNATTRSTLLNTAISFGLALTAIIGMSAYLSFTQISRPIKQLTRAMGELSNRHYDERIEHTERRDEVGSMAQALQVFRDGMQRADRLELEARASAEARRVSQQLIDLTDAMPGAVFQLTVDADGTQRFTFLSGKAQGFIGSEALVPDGTGLRLDGIRVERNVDVDRQIELAIDHSLETLQPLDIDMQVELDNRRFWLKTLASARRAENGSILFNGIWLDISDIKAQARALEDAKELAEQAAKAKATFLATMSHEIRTPMNAILGLTQLTLRHPLEPSQQDRLEKILRAGQHLLGMLNDILDYSKIDADRLLVEAIPFSPQQLLDEVAQMLEERAASKGLELRTEVAGDPPLLLGDPLRISQILLNFASNALKFSERGRVSLRLALEHDACGSLVLCGEVEDQGIGISKEEMGSLFLPFQQADASITRRFGGTGLGLAISRSLAELMGGEVGARSQPGAGSTFWFRVRVAEAQSTQVPQSLHASGGAIKALDGLRVLLVDDNELNRLVAGELLVGAGMRVDHAVDGRHAITLLEQAQDDTYDAVLMDLMMPEMDGLSATRLLREQPRFGSLPIIAMTANASPQDVQQCLAAGMSAHIAKPIDEQRLWKTLLQCCVPGEPSPMTLPTDSSTEPSGQAVVLDPQPLEHLRRVVAPERFHGMLEMLITDCRRRGESFRGLYERPDIPVLRQHVHDLIGTAGHAGFRQVVELGAAMRVALDAADETVIRGLIGELDLAIQQAERVLKQHFDVAEPIS